jgi:hypothetical protein
MSLKYYVSVTILSSSTNVDGHYDCKTTTKSYFYETLEESTCDFYLN